MTQLKYMDHQYLYQDEAQILALNTLEDGRVDLLLNQTIFYPQGGGQPYDQGTIKSGRATFDVQEIRFFEDQVHHIGVFTEGSFDIGETVSLDVNEERRYLNARSHSAGHIIDQAVTNLGYDWHPTKGCHFPGQCFVEYEGALEDGVEYVSNIEAEVNRMINEGYQTQAKFVEKSELDQICHFVLPDMPTDKPTRVVYIWGDMAVPCGGTHVQNVADIKQISIKKVKARKNLIKVSYEL